MRFNGLGSRGSAMSDSCQAITQEVQVRLLSGDARRAVFAPLDDGSLRSEAVTRRVGSAIALGLLGDGEQLPAEAELATLLNVSTVTLAGGACRVCASSGWCETRRGRGGGSFVRSRDDALAELADSRLAEVGTTDLRELGDVHGAVAAAAARLAAARASAPGDLTAPGPRLGRGSRRESVPAQRRIDGRWYIEVAACAQSVRLTMLEMDLHVELGQLPWPPAHSPLLLDAIVDNHHAVVDAIEARDVGRARVLRRGAHRRSHPMADRRCD